MRILIFLPHVTGLSGGADVYLLYLAKALGRDHKVAIITEKNKDAQYEPEEIYARYGLSNIKTYYFRPVFRSGDKNALKSFLWERMTNAQVASLCKRIKPDLFINGIENKIIARRYGYTMHIVHFPVPCYQSKWLGWLDKRYIDSYDLLVSNSGFTRYHLKQMYGKDSMILNPPLIFPLLDRNQLADKENIILAVGRLIPDKKIMEMIAAYRRVAQESEIPYDFVIIGNRNHSEDTFYNRIVEAANEPNAPGHVEVHSDVAYEQLLEWYKKAKIFWHAKGYGVTDEHPRDMEHFGMVTVEAMSQGCIPVVIGKAGQLEIMTGALAKLTWQTPDELVAITMELIRDENRIRALQNVVISEAEKYGYENFSFKARQIIDVLCD